MAKEIEQSWWTEIVSKTRTKKPKSRH